MPDTKDTNEIPFTKTKIKSLKPGAKRKTYRHTSLKGYILEVSPAGTKTFRVYKRIKGQNSPIKVTLGTFPDLTVEKAEKKALETLSLMANGINPNEQRAQDKKLKTTFIEVYEAYKKTKTYTSKTLTGYDQCINAYVKDWHDKPLVDIKDEDIKERHKLISLRSEAQADYCMRVVRAMFNYAMHEFKNLDGKKVIEDNPVDILKHQRLWNDVARKQTRLTKTEISALYEVLERYRSAPDSSDFMLAVCDFVEFALFTGLRKTELLKLEWSRVNIDDQFFYISKTKNGDRLELPLTDHLLTILERRRLASTNDYVFQADNEYGYIREPRKCIDKICGACKFEFNLHDLRRTFTSIAELNKVGSYVLKRLLNHKTKRDDVTGGYTIFTAEELRGPSEEVQNVFLESMGLPLYGKSIDVRLRNFVNQLSNTEKEKALKLLEAELD